MSDFLSELFTETFANHDPTAIFFFVIGVVMHLLPARHLLWFAPLVNVPAAIVQVVVGFAVRLGAPILLLVVFLGSAFTYNELEGRPHFGQVKEIGTPLLIIFGGYLLAMLTAGAVSLKASQVAAAQTAADQARLAQKIVDEDL